MRFKPTDKRREFKPRRPAAINHIEIPACVQRDIILERDPVFCGNMRQLKDSPLPAQQKGAHRNWLVMASLRRNHVPLSEARRLASA